MRSVTCTLDDLEDHFIVKNHEYGYLQALTRGFSDNVVDMSRHESIPFPAQANSPHDSDNEEYYFPPRQPPSSPTDNIPFPPFDEKSEDEVELVCN